MTDSDPSSFEDDLIADMRANGGVVTAGPLAGHPLLIMTSRGARTGQARRAILTFTRDGVDHVVAASNGGATTDPAWLLNLQADPGVTVEAEGRTFEARASITDDADRDRLWTRHVEALPQFGEYPETSGRVIPMVRLTPVE